MRATAEWQAARFWRNTDEGASLARHLFESFNLDGAAEEEGDVGLRCDLGGQGEPHAPLVHVPCGVGRRSLS